MYKDLTDPCRFCGSKKNRVGIESSRGEGEKPLFSAFVECLSCHARGPAATSTDAPAEYLKVIAIGNWNYQKPLNSEGKK